MWVLWGSVAALGGQSRESSQPGIFTLFLFHLCCYIGTLREIWLGNDFDTFVLNLTTGVRLEV